MVKALEAAVAASDRESVAEVDNSETLSSDSESNFPAATSPPHVDSRRLPSSSGDRGITSTQSVVISSNQREKDLCQPDLPLLIIT